MKQIAESLKADGVLTGGKGTNWGSSGVNRILKNEKYMGDALLQKTYTVDLLTKKRVKNNGIMPQYYVENDHPAIIFKSVFMQVQNLIRQRRNGITTKNGHHRKVNGKYCFFATCLLRQMRGCFPTKYVVSSNKGCSLALC